MHSFSELAKRNLKYYVYILCDCNNKPFYVGKGSGDRIFEHEKETVESTSNIVKYSKIHDCIDQIGKLNKYIIHSGLTESETFACELSLIKILKFYDTELSNDVNGHHDLFDGCLSPEQIETRLGSMKVNCSIFSRKDRVMRYHVRPKNDFNVDKTIEGLMNYGLQFSRNKQSPLYIALFHKKIFEGIYSIKTEQFDEPNPTNPRNIRHRIKITSYEPTDKYNEYIGFTFEDVYSNTETRIQCLY